MRVADCPERLLVQSRHPHHFDAAYGFPHICDTLCRMIADSIERMTRVFTKLVVDYMSLISTSKLQSETDVAEGIESTLQFEVIWLLQRGTESILYIAFRGHSQSPGKT